MGQVDNSELRTILNPYFATRNDFYDPAVSLARTTSFLMSIPGMRGLWPPGGHYYTPSTGYLINLAVPYGDVGHLTQNGTSLIKIHGGTRPQIAFSGTGQWAFSADHGMWDITGTEAYIASGYKGLTMGAWVWFDGAASATEYVLTKGYGATNLSYSLNRTSVGEGRFFVSGDSTTAIAVDSGADIIGGSKWVFMCGRFDPSTEIKLFLNDEEYINTTSVPASISVGTADFFMAGRDDGATPGQLLLDGTISMAWICAMRLEDKTIRYIYQMSKPIYDTYWEP